MHAITFAYRQKLYSGRIISSTQEYPHYYWCLIDDHELAFELDDCIAFRKNPGQPLTPVYTYPKRFDGLLQTMAAVISAIRDETVKKKGA
jgi:hypothetical protein